MACRPTVLPEFRRFFSDAKSRAALGGWRNWVAPCRPATTARQPRKRPPPRARHV